MHARKVPGQVVEIAKTAGSDRATRCHAAFEVSHGRLPAALRFFACAEADRSAQGRDRTDPAAPACTGVRSPYSGRHSGESRNPVILSLLILEHIPSKRYCVSGSTHGISNLPRISGEKIFADSNDWNKQITSSRCAARWCARTTPVLVGQIAPTKSRAGGGRIRLTG